MSRRTCLHLGILVLTALLLWLIIVHPLIPQRLLTHLALPVGLVWLGLAIMTVVALRRGSLGLAWLAGSVWLVHTVSGSGFLASLLNRTLEMPYARVVPLEEKPFDVVIVLGGGTKVGLNQQSQVNPHGDRIVLAARLYHAGLVDRLIVTGQRTAGLSVDPTDPAQQALELLVQLGVPVHRVQQVAGRNTAEEMHRLAALLEPDQRCGLVTSAWHMKRALRLANRHGLAFTPLPADFRSDSTLRLTASDLIPDADSSMRFNAATKEYIARLVGR